MLYVILLATALCLRKEKTCQNIIITILTTIPMLKVVIMKSTDGNVLAWN